MWFVSRRKHARILAERDEVLGDAVAAAKRYRETLRAVDDYLFAGLNTDGLSSEALVRMPHAKVRAGLVRQVREAVRDDG
jgi:hypothetical protein